MLHLTLVVPVALTRPVLAYLDSTDFVINVVHLPGAGRKPKGDLIACDVASEEASAVIEALRSLGCDTRGTISVETLDASISVAAERAEEHADGSPADAVVWESVAARASESAELSLSFLIFMVLATMIAAVGVLTDSVVLIIGAMVVGPEFGPLAGVCVGLVQRRFHLAGRSLLALLVGLPVGIMCAYALTLLLVQLGIAPVSFTSPHPQTLFISRPDAYSAIIALMAGVAGMISLTTAKSGALIGVLISVTTVPAAGNVGVAAAYQNFSELRGAAAQLGINLLMLLVAGTLTVQLQHFAFRRRVARQQAASVNDDRTLLVR
ncbi:MAG TPA: DUF389 domain-containing protein [Polyangiaceae bacterium]|nr:DUF389 domain-containing protein [Polyangiaceae bacterium]